MRSLRFSCVLTVAMLAACSSPAPTEKFDCESAALAVVDAGGPLQAGCAADGDCVVAPVHLSCFEGCGFPMPASHVAQFNAILQSIEQDICSQVTCHTIDDCAVFTAACTGGRCVSVLTVPDGG